MPPIINDVKMKLTKEPAGFKCDVCKQAFPFTGQHADPVIISHRFGYGSQCDDCCVDATICEPCAIELCKKNDIPITDNNNVSIPYDEEIDAQKKCDKNWDSFFGNNNSGGSHLDEALRSLQANIDARRTLNNLAGQEIHVIELVIQAIKVFGDRAESLTWLEKPNEALGGHAPILHAQDHPDQVSSLLYAIRKMK